jgi:hypothetical protein
MKTSDLLTSDSWKVTLNRLRRSVPAGPLIVTPTYCRWSGPVGPVTIGPDERTAPLREGDPQRRRTRF